MEVQSFIQASAKITRVTELVKGNVYKRYDNPSYGEPKLTYGIVTDVLHNGTDAVVQAVEFDPSYSGVDVKLKTFGGGQNITIFPALQSELKLYLEEGADVVKRKVKEKERELFDAKQKLVEVEKIINGTMVQELTSPSFTDQPAPAIEASTDDSLEENF